MHAIGQDNLVCQGQSPWLHRVLLSKMHLLQLGVGMVGNGVSLWPFDSIVPDLSLNLLIDGERGRGSRLWVLVVLNYGCLRHIRFFSRPFLLLDGIQLAGLVVPLMFRMTCLLLREGKH